MQMKCYCMLMGLEWEGATATMARWLLLQASRCCQPPIVPELVTGQGKASVSNAHIQWQLLRNIQRHLPRNNAKTVAQM